MDDIGFVPTQIDPVNYHQWIARRSWRLIACAGPAISDWTDPNREPMR
jgi:hypothetical protein